MNQPTTQLSKFETLLHDDLFMTGPMYASECDSRQLRALERLRDKGYVRAEDRPGKGRTFIPAATLGVKPKDRTKELKMSNGREANKLDRPKGYLMCRGKKGSGRYWVVIGGERFRGEDLITPKEAATLLDRTPATVRRLARCGRLRSVLVLGMIAVFRSEVRRLRSK